MKVILERIANALDGIYSSAGILTFLDEAHGNNCETCQLTQQQIFKISHEIREIIGFKKVAAQKKPLDMAHHLIKNDHQGKREMKLKIDPPLTKSQEMDICFIIGEWYLDWKKRLVNFETKEHSLGFAAQNLKDRLCDMADTQENEK